MILAPIVAFESLGSWVEFHRIIGLKIAFTNGVFDLMHVGHDHLLRSIHESLADYDFKLIVAVNSDESVAGLKPGRPIYSQDQRIQMLRSHRAVDAVTLFDSPTPLTTIYKIMPDFLIKGGDYEGRNIVGCETVTQTGGEVIFIPSMEHKLARTTGIIKAIKQLEE